MRVILEKNKVFISREPKEAKKLIENGWKEVKPEEPKAPKKKADKEDK